MNTRPLVIVNESLAAARSPEWQKAVMHDVLKRDLHFFNRNPRARLRVRPFVAGEVFPIVAAYTHVVVARIDAGEEWRVLRLHCTADTLPETVTRANSLIVLGGVK